MKHKRILIALVVCCFCFGLLLSPPAHATGAATTVAIVGTLAMSVPVIAQLATMAMDAAGMTPALRVAASDADTPLQAFVEAAFLDFCSRNSLAVGTALRVASVGAKYYQDGSISFDSNLSDMFGGFLGYMWSEDGANLQASAPADTGDLMRPVNMSGVDRTPMDHYNYTFNLYATSGNQLPLGGSNYIAVSRPVYMLQYDTVVYLYSDQTFLYSDIYGGTPNRQASGVTRNGVTYYSGGGIRLYGSQQTMYTRSNIYNSGNNRVATIEDNNYRWDIAYILTHSVILNPGVANPGVLDLPENTDINILKPQDKMENLPDFGPAIDAGATVAVADYIQSVFDGIENGDYSLPTTDAATGESAGTIEGEMSQTQAMELDQTLTSDLTAPGTGIVTDTAPADLGPYTLDLTAYFPFCIPWDIGAMISYLQATPEAPHFEWTLNVPNLVNYTFEIDLAVFDPVAAVLRQMELLAFAVGLAAGTKSLIQGGD